MHRVLNALEKLYQGQGINRQQLDMANRVNRTYKDYTIRNTCIEISYLEVPTPFHPGLYLQEPLDRHAHQDHREHLIIQVLLFE